jgi:ZIP family zinc transporter
LLELLLRVALVSFVAGVGGTGVGGLLAVMLGRPARNVLSAMLGFAAGIMLAIVGLELFPEAIRRGGLLSTSLGMLSGVILIYVLDAFVPHTHANPDDKESSRFVRSAMLIGLGVALHNLPEGVAIGSGYASGTAFGLAVVAMVFLHNVPEGLAVASPYLAAGRSWAAAIRLTAFTGLTEVAGALIGAAVSAVSPLILSFSLALAGGAMLFILADELIPGAHELASGHAATMGLVGGVLAGMVLSVLFTGI